ncbi:amidase family protein [Bradyrhizobium huanghuaihaiense]|uniref:amidase family protein n=1 Tax=Bradyrhizobium huanghuaihaiense TaxID=990078 RepID=UPI0021AA6DF9|nr:amidase family protein [Bradyrhizobium sp. CB3035]UWU81609.1 amidase family protein [Bradyrhizobium sp. CB3035]
MQVTGCPTPLRIGVVTHDFAGPAEEESEAALRKAASAAQRAGANVQHLELPGIFAETWQIQANIWDFELHRALAWEYQTHHDAIAPKLRARMDETVDIPPAPIVRRCTPQTARALHSPMHYPIWMWS